MLIERLDEGDPEHRHRASGRCIYCRKAFPDPELSEEHVVPAGLGGALVLEHASCTECQRMIEPIETHVI
jgi:hypothetical protein